jgi:hypothetical protein
MISIENERAKKLNMSALINTLAKKTKVDKKYSQLNFNKYLLINIFEIYGSTYIIYVLKNKDVT